MLSRPQMDNGSSGRYIMVASMLESSTLSLGPWSPPSETASARREIRDAPTGRHLGLARWLIPPRPGWRGWFRLPILEIVESEDESLLCTLRRSWRLLPSWDVLDADGRFVGSTRWGILYDPLGRRFAEFLPPVGDHVGSFLDPSGQHVGSLIRKDGALQLAFGPAIQEEPFAKMMVLAAALLAE